MSLEPQAQQTLEQYIEDLDDVLKDIKSEVETIGQNVEWIEENIEKADELIKSEWLEHQDFAENIKNNLRDLKDIAAEMRELSRTAKVKIEKLTK